MRVIKISKISKSFQVEEQKLEVLKNVSFEVERSEFLSIIGPSGCGKSTLLRILAGIQKQDSGEITYFETPKSSFVFQSFALFPWLTAAENISFPLKLRGDKDYSRKAQELVRQMGLTGFENKHPKELSGGMKQRVGIARAISINPDILFMDEPFSALDAFTAGQLRAEILKIWKERKMTTILVTHLVSEAVELSDRVIVMTPRPGRIEQEFKINLARPRNTRSPEFFKVVDEIAKKIHFGGK